MVTTCGEADQSLHKQAEAQAAHASANLPQFGCFPTILGDPCHENGVHINTTTPQVRNLVLLNGTFEVSPSNAAVLELLAAYWKKGLLGQKMGIPWDQLSHSVGPCALSQPMPG
ncbi:hypothetical protein EDC04DRAFT_2607493 [Pisolithus marmoratus]|nr:hypothetical protein EDC04DRAFT_2607493 [Pisolithus marmoratus]